MTIRAYMADGTIGVYPNAYIYWEWGDDEERSDSGFRINAMDRNFTSAVAFVYPGECEKIIISSEESDRVFKSPPKSEGMGAKQYKIFKAIDEERKRQDKKWGGQDMILHAHDGGFPFRQELNSAAKVVREDFRRSPAWFSLLLKELSDAFLAREPGVMRKRMIRVAAVVTRIIEYLDRKMEENDERH
jgi:hypothetical protein